MSATHRLMFCPVVLLVLGFGWTLARGQDRDRPVDRPVDRPDVARPDADRPDHPQHDRPHLIEAPRDVPKKPDVHPRRDLPPRPDVHVRRDAGPGGPPRNAIGPHDPVVPHRDVPRGDHRPGGGVPDHPQPKPPFPPGPQAAPAGPGPGPGGPIDPEMVELDRKDFELGHQCMELSMRYRHAPEPEKEEIRRGLDELVNQHFDVRQERREFQLRQLEEELERLRRAIQRRAEAREQIVSKRIAELLGEEDDLGF